MLRLLLIFFLIGLIYLHYSHALGPIRHRDRLAVPAKTRLHAVQRPHRLLVQVHVSSIVPTPSSRSCLFGPVTARKRILLDSRAIKSDLQFGGEKHPNGPKCTAVTYMQHGNITASALLGRLLVLALVLCTYMAKCQAQLYLERLLILIRHR